MKSSARNQFFGTVKAIQAGATNDTVEIALSDNQSLVATVTSESTKKLNLEAGREVFALIKASSIILVSGVEKMHFSARNQFAGTVARVKKGAVNTEVVVTVGESTMAAIITNDSAEHLALTEGSAVTAIFKASSVIIGCSL